MKNLFILFFLLLAPYTKCSSQTKSEALLSLGEKIDIHKFYNSKKNYNYLLEEVDFNHKKTIKFIQFCTAFKLCSTAYYLTTKEYLEIKVNKKNQSKYIQIFFPKNSIKTKKINIKTEEHFKGKNASSIIIFLEKNTLQSDVNKIKNGFVDLFKMYNINKRKL